MKFLRIILPFLFVRNWYTGVWELSPARIVLFGAFLILFGVAISIVIVLQAPIEYSSHT